VDKQLIKDEILTELRLMVQVCYVNRGSADRVRAKTLLKISGCTVAENGSISVDSSSPIFEALINLQDTDMIFLSNMQKTRPSGQAGNEAKFHASQPQKLNLKELIWTARESFPAQKKR
jgi:hypothetical protein